MSRRCWTGMGPFRRRWPGSWSQTGRGRFTGCWWTRGTGPRWRSAGRVTGSQVRCGRGCGCGTGRVRSRGAATTPWTTMPITSSPGPRAAPPESATWDSRARNTTNSGTPPAGNPPRPPRTTHPAGPHPQAATIKANTKTGNQPTGRTESGRTESGTAASISFAMVLPPGKMPLRASCVPTPDYAATGGRLCYSRSAAGGAGVLAEQTQLVRRIYVLAGGLVAAVHVVHQIRVGAQETTRSGIARHRRAHGAAQGGVDDQGVPAAEARAAVVVGITTAVRGGGDPARLMPGQEPLNRRRGQARLIDQGDQEVIRRIRGVVAEQEGTAHSRLPLGVGQDMAAVQPRGRFNLGRTCTEDHHHVTAAAVEQGSRNGLNKWPSTERKQGFRAQPQARAGPRGEHHAGGPHPR